MEEILHIWQCLTFPSAQILHVNILQPSQTHQSFCRCIDFPKHHCDIYRESSHSSPIISLLAFCDLFPLHLLALLFLLLRSCFSLQMALVISPCLIIPKPRLFQKLFALVSLTIWNSLFFCCFFLPHRFFIYFQISSENISAPMPVSLNFSFPLLLCVI